MPYRVFALKWRPKNFDEIIGQAHVVNTLKNAIQKNRLAHAYLFAGPRGVGKTSTARILAKALNCKEGPTVNPCQKCPSCVQITDGRSLDVIEIDGASNRGIDEIRVLRENVKFSPTAGKYKVYIIDEVHMLTQEAFNALLKTLEEPPEFVKFIFATTQPHKVIPTILSRCHRFDFRRISVMEITAQLERIVASEKIGIDKEVMLAIAKTSDGSLRDAESVLDQLTSFSKEKISLKDAISVLGLIEQDALFQITDKIIQKDAGGALELFNQLIDEGKDISVFLSNFTEHFRNLMIAKVTGANVKLMDLPPELCERLFSQSQAFSLEEIFNAFNILVNTQEMAKRLESLRIPLEISLVRLAYGKKGIAAADPPHHKSPSPPPKEVHIEKHQENKNSNEGINPIDPPGSSINISLDSVKSTWKDLIENLKKLKMSVATYLNDGQPLKVQGHLVTICFPKDYSLHKEALEKKENKAIIEKGISELLNLNLRVNFILSDDYKARDVSEESLSIKSALDIFNGRVIKEE